MVSDRTVVPCSATVLLLEVTNVYESHMRDGKLYDLAVLNPDGRVGHMMIHERELQGVTWFSSRVLKFVE